MKKVLFILLMFSVTTMILLPGCKSDPAKTEQAISQTIDAAHEIGFVEDSTILGDQVKVYEAAKAWIAAHPQKGEDASAWVTWLKVGGGILLTFLLGLWGYFKAFKSKANGA